MQRPATWDEALGAVADGLGRVRARYGSRAIAVQSGWGLVHNNAMGWLKRLCDAMATPNYISASSICVGSSRLASILTFGRETRGDFFRSSLAVLWGFNPFYSRPPLADVLLRRQRQGMKLVVVDPIRTALAARADLHVAPRPGTDLALALGVLNEVIGRQVVDRAFIDRDTTGFDELAAAVAPVTPEWVSRATGVAPEVVRTLAGEISSADGASLFTGVALEHGPAGFQTCRAIDCLWAVTGNVNRPGGNQVLPGMGTEAVEAARTLPPVPEGPRDPPIGADRFPLFAEVMGEAQGNLLPRAILRGEPYPVKALLVFGANPVLSGAASSLQRQSLEALELLVVADPIVTETARMAHVVLPVASFLEADDTIVVRSIGELEAALPAVGEAWPQWKIIFELARSFDLGRYFPWASGRQARDEQYERFRQTPVSERSYRTPSGKVELASNRLRDLGLSPVPVPDEARPPTRDPRFSLLLVTGARQPAFCNSQLRGISPLELRVGPPVVSLSRVTASRLGFVDGDAAMLETASGAIEVTLSVSDDLPPEVLSAPHCRRELNINNLTNLDDLDPVTGFPNFRSIPCRLTTRSS